MLYPKSLLSFYCFSVGQLSLYYRFVDKALSTLQELFNALIYHAFKTVRTIQRFLPKCFNGKRTSFTESYRFFKRSFLFQFFCRYSFQFIHGFSRNVSMRIELRLQHHTDSLNPLFYFCFFAGIPSFSFLDPSRHLPKDDVSKFVFFAWALTRPFHGTDITLVPPK